MKRAYVIHRWDGTPKSDWYPWLKKELEKTGFKVEVPTMPNTSTPKINDWVTHLKKVVGKLDNETYFIGHSIGCQTIMRFLEEENYNEKIGKVVFVAGWFKLGNLEGEEVESIANPWINTPIDFNKVKPKLSKLSVFLSTNEPYGFVEENSKIFKESLDAKVTILKDKGHFTEDDRVDKLSDILKEFDENKTNCIIIHGCPSDSEKAMNPQTRTYDKHWIPWTKQQLIFKGIEVETPLMPEPWNPNYEKFKKEFEKYNVNENSILIGHSCGCAFLVRWLGETKQKINMLILVAPWKIPDKDDAFRKEFYTYPIDKTIKNRINKIVIFTADDEEEDGKKSIKIYHKDLGGKIIELEGHGHYTMDDMGTEEFPQLIEEVLN